MDEVLIEQESLKDLKRIYEECVRWDLKFVVIGGLSAV